MLRSFVRTQSNHGAIADSWRAQVAARDVQTSAREPTVSQGFDKSNPREAGVRDMDSRATLRYPVDLVATITVGATDLACSVRNLSLGGVYVRGPSLTIGTRVRLRFGGPKPPVIDARCTSRWVTPDGCGLEFDDLRAIDTYALAKLIRAASRATGRIPTDAVLRPH
jgi:PilZ domain-containing protein